MDCRQTSLRTRLAAVAASMAVIACSAVAAFLVGWRPAVADTAPLAAYGRLPSLEDVVISPDGTKLAFVKTKGENRNLAVVPLNKHEVVGGAHVGNVKLRDIEWVDDDNILATISSTSPPPFGFIGPTREWYQLANFNISKLKISPLSFEFENVYT